MKTKVILVVALLVGLAASAQAATIKNTKHDLSSTGGGSIKDTVQSQVCVFCHVPHNAITNKLLWNRTNTVAASVLKIYTSYNSSVMRTAFIGTTQLPADSSSILCLSCHSLATAGAVITNTGNNKALNGSGLGTTDWATAGLGANLTNDHPVGIDYSNAVISAGNAFVPTVTASGVVTNAGVTLKLFKSGSSTDSTLECGTCHTVHDNTNGKFLATNNTGSKLCTTCHVK